MNKTYKIIKRVFIIPFLVITILGTSLYASYMQPTTVEAATTGNPFLDFFITALMITGFSVPSREDAENIFKDFSSYYNELMYDYNSRVDGSYSKSYEDWKSDCVKEYGETWSDMTNFEKMLRVDNNYTKGKFREITGEDWRTAEGFASYQNWLKENFVDSNPFEKVSGVSFWSIPLSVKIAKLVQDGKYNSKYTSEEWLSTTGNFACLVKLLVDFVSKISTKLYDAANDIFNKTIGTIISNATLQTSGLYKFLISDDYDNLVNSFVGNTRYFNQKNADLLIQVKNYFINNLPSDYANKLKYIGDKYVLILRTYQYNSGSFTISMFLADVPEDASIFKCVGNSSYYYQFYDSEDNLLNSDTYLGTLINYSESADSYSFYLNFNQNYWSWEKFNWKFAHINRNTKFGSIDQFDIYIPFGLSNVSIDNYQWGFSPDKYYDIDTGVYTGAIASYDFEKTNTDASDLVGNNVDVDDVDAVDTSVSIDNTKDLTDSKVDAIDKTTADVIDSANDKADTKDDAKDDADTDTDTKEDIKTDVDVPDDMKDYTPKLIDLFPFCIPFDIYRFLKCLAADPEAPVIDFPLITENSFGIPPYTLHLDFSKFDDVAKILRTMELLGFCVGLAFVTNNLIKH